ncbi:MAG: hypothetical protein ACREKE_04545 [bacterium]
MRSIMADVSSTAQAVAQLGTLNIPDILALAASVVVAALASPALQAVIEGLVAKVIPAPLFFVKPFLPSAFSAVAGGIAAHLGVAPDDAVAGAAALASLTHWVNEQPWAASLEAKSPPAAKAAEAALGIGKPLALLLGLALLAGTAHATVAASYGGLFGSGTWSVGSGGQLVATGSTLAGAEVNVGYGSLSGTAFSPDAVLALGGAWENQDGKEYGDLVLGLGPTIPGTTSPLIVGPAWRLFSGEAYPAIMVSTTFTFGTPFWIGK